MKKKLIKLSVKFFEFIYKKQNEKKIKRLNALNKKILSSNISGEKSFAISGATLAIKEKTEKEKKANSEKIEKIVQMYLNEPKKLFDYIKGAKTKIHVFKGAKKFLSFINEDEGFILPKKGFKAFYLNFFLNKKFSFSTKEMFVMSSYNVNIYAFVYQFYNWYCFKMNLTGYDSENQENFRHVFEICETKKITSLSYEEILGLKCAIRRDIEAIEFVKKLAVKNSMAKKNLEKIKSGKKVNI